MSWRDLFRGLVRLENLFNLFCTKDFSLADPRTKRGHFFLPSFRAHILWPKGPGPTLVGSTFVDGATLVGKKLAVLIRTFQMPVTIRFFTVGFSEIFERQFQKSRHSLLIGDVQVNVPVTAARGAALAASLAFELDRAFFQNLFRRF